jgi:hypothetical protein
MTSAYSSLGVLQELNPQPQLLKARSNHSATSAVYMICVEVEQGEVRPYKNINLCREVLSMRLPPTQAGGQVLGNTFIDGAHMVLAGPTRGQLHLLYQNSEVN